MCTHHLLTRHFPIRCANGTDRTSWPLGIGGVSGNELLIVFLPFFLAAGFLAWVLTSLFRICRLKL
jgi:hypothetical protein